MGENNLLLYKRPLHTLYYFLCACADYAVGSVHSHLKLCIAVPVLLVALAMSIDVLSFVIFSMMRLHTMLHTLSSIGFTLELFRL